MPTPIIVNVIPVTPPIKVILQWVTSVAGPGGSVAWADVTGKPSTFTPSAHNQAASTISDSTTVGRALLTAVDVTAQRSALGLGNSATLSTGTSTGTVALGDHNHTGIYATVSHNHDGTYSLLSHNHDGVYSPVGHNHSGTYANASHTHAPSELTAGGASVGQILTWNGTIWAPANAPSGGSVAWGDVTGKPSTFTPSSHTHSLSDLNQSGASTGQVVTWNGSAWVPSTPAGGSVAWGDITGKPTTFTPASHTHALSELTQSGATTNQVPSWNGTAWVPVTVTPTIGDGTITEAKLVDGVVWKKVWKTSATSRSSTTTLTEDPHLVVPIAANQTLHIKGTVFFDTAATPDIKFGHTSPAGATVRVYRKGIGGGGTALTGIQVDTANLTSGAAVAGSGASGVFEFYAVIENSSTAGNFALTWAQNTSDAANTTIRAWSLLEYIEAPTS